MASIRVNSVAPGDNSQKFANFTPAQGRTLQIFVTDEKF